VSQKKLTAAQDAICRFAPQFQGTDQHDSQEFLAFLLDGLHEDLNFVQQKPAPIPYTPEREAELEMLPQQIGGEREWNVYLRRENSVIVAWFQGQYRSKLQCLTCSKVHRPMFHPCGRMLSTSEQTSTTYNNFMYLTLALPSHRGLGSHKVTLDSLLSAYVQEEVLDKDDAWCAAQIWRLRSALLSPLARNCPRCKVPRKASKKLSLSRLPPILIIHLKRFQFKGPFSDKIDTPVHFPLYGLDMGQFVAPPLPPAQAAQYAKLAPDAIPRPPPSNMYDLYAVSEQIGTLSSGHCALADFLPECNH
jgi:ubiquitin carboxyl-terminal hydrolase 8